MMAPNYLGSGLAQGLGQVGSAIIQGANQRQMYDARQQEMQWLDTQHQHMQKEWQDQSAYREALAQAAQEVGPQRPDELPEEYSARINQVAAAKLGSTGRGDMAIQFSLAGANSAAAARGAKQKAKDLAHEEWAKRVQMAYMSNDPNKLLQAVRSEPSGMFQDATSFNHVMKNENGVDVPYVSIGFQGNKPAYEIPQDVALEILSHPEKGGEVWRQHLKDQREQQWRLDQVRMHREQVNASRRNPQLEVLEAAAEAQKRLADDDALPLGSPNKLSPGERSRLAVFAGRGDELTGKNKILKARADEVVRQITANIAASANDLTQKDKEGRAKSVAALELELQRLQNQMHGGETSDKKSATEDLPDDKSKLVVGKVYKTRQGNARYLGNGKFEEE